LVKIDNHQVGNLSKVSLKGCAGVFADSESNKRRQFVLLSVLESIMTQPARIFSEGVTHLFFTLKYENSPEIL
jgi:hypothetical protein